MAPSVEPQFGALPDRPNERIRVADVARANALLAWASETTLDRGLAATIDWYMVRGSAA
jgi:nucleoside-diphosphate-sugar epimerase